MKEILAIDPKKAIIIPSGMFGMFLRDFELQKNSLV
jgi:hypothetical protein